ncbi:hypothetical protein CcCBS67573_g07670 [Chytriomyces confervae]|uniref:STAS domain-containing protein n=1 Tax=Chytriomyces confervae TaxID=246404 RepID=A0A507ES63_9FUNG|nr:Sulfate permease 2 [Chytriomyces hyalinus]TPX66913.1 hypothetical protein CcCBS67573_g07670 [Chytriomyces confervae]
MSYTQKPPTQQQEIRAAVSLAFKNLPRSSANHLYSIFPILNWIRRYNLQWFIGDVIAGVTVGLIAIPQGISYSAKLAGLPAQFGLYTAFLGAFIYTFFATSKDVTIGATAVLSLIVGQQLAIYAPKASPTELVVFSATLAFWTGVFELIIGVLRIGTIVDFVPVPVIAGFTSGAGIQIIIQQTPGLLGVKGVNTNNAPYLVIGDFFTAVSKGGANGVSQWDAIFGLSSLALLLLIKFGTQIGQKKYPWLKFVGFLRNAIVLIIFTGISYGVKDNKAININIVKNIPYGLSGILQANYTLPYASTVMQALPAVLIVAILEHIAVSKTYGRVNGYAVDPNQEITALGLTNIFGSFVGAIPATGSFSRSAIKSASGVRSPIASFITALVVITALFTITSTLYYIPSATLSAIVATAISELVNFNVVKPSWEVEVLDFIGFWIAFWVVFFASIEIAIFASVGFSVLVLLIRIARPKVTVLSRASDGTWLDSETAKYYGNVSGVTAAPEGILVFKIDESLAYPNSGFFLSKLNEAIFNRFIYTGPSLSNSEKLWCDDSEERAAKREKSDDALILPPLKAIVFDFSAASRVDFTGLQAFLDAKADTKRFTGRDVPFHFAYVRPQQINVLLRVNRDSATSLDPTPALPKDSNNVLVNLFKKKAVEENTDEKDQLRFFHGTVDAAVRAAEAETVEVV